MMEFGWSEAQRAYRGEVRQALEDFLPADWEEISRGGMGSAPQIDFSREFAPKLAERGLLTPQWPSQYGGRDASPWEQFILAEEMKSAGEPRGPQYMNTNWIGPTLMRYGSEAQKAQHLPPIAGGSVIWCQCYSEPGAGTDLAALQTRAERRGDVYVVNGQKIWTSYSYKADWCFLLVRTGPGRKDISILMLPMSTPGVEVKPFPGLVEQGHLNEVFFTDVEVPVSSRLGEESRAWEIILYALSFERVGIPRYHIGRQVLDHAVRQLQAEERFEDDVVRSRAAGIVAQFEVARHLTYLVVDQRAKALPPSVDANVSRVSAAQACLDLMDFITEYLPDSLAGGNETLDAFYRGNISSTIAAGTYEIQLNLIAQQALTLPKGA
jgi:alkylation response protein AidB-like acyl-CoA dehydrogenase